MGQWKSGAEATAVQTLRDQRTPSLRAERLDCVRFTAAFVRQRSPFKPDHHPFCIGGKQYHLNQSLFVGVTAGLTAGFAAGAGLRCCQ